jgi:type I restriction enzyme S subunit
MLTIGALSPLEITLPKIDEQRRIANVLRSVDEAIAANEAALASCRALVVKLARDVTESCEVTTTMASFGKIVTGRTPSPKQADLWGGDLPFMTPGDLAVGNISVSDASRTLVADSGHGATVLPANSVLVTCIGSTVGKAAIARERCVTNQQINAICCPAQTAGFVYLASIAAYDTIVANAGKQAVPIINKSTFSAIEVPAMSQDKMFEISAMVDAIDEEIVAAQTSMETLHRTKATLMSDLLSGRVRVPA